MPAIIKHNGKQFKIERMPNGFYLVFHYGPNWSGCYNADGSHRHGDCDYAGQVVRQYVISQWTMVDTSVA
jgi:hypothetical protein